MVGYRSKNQKTSLHISSGMWWKPENVTNQIKGTQIQALKLIAMTTNVKIFIDTYNSKWDTARETISQVEAELEKNIQNSTLWVKGEKYTKETKRQKYTVGRKKCRFHWLMGKSHQGKSDILRDLARYFFFIKTPHHKCSSNDCQWSRIHRKKIWTLKYQWDFT